MFKSTENEDRGFSEVVLHRVPRSRDSLDSIFAIRLYHVAFLYGSLCPYSEYGISITMSTRALKRGFSEIDENISIANAPTRFP